NVTGFNVSEPTQSGKWVELLKEVVPRVATVAILFNPASATYAEYWLKPFQAAAGAFAVEAIAAPVRDGSELDSVFAAQAREPNSGLIAMPDSFTDANRVEIPSLAARRGGRKAGLDHFGIEVEDLEKVRQKVAKKYPDIEIVKRPGNRPFASYSAHDPAGNYFDL